MPYSYIGQYVHGRENFTAITYNPETMVWTLTANGAMRVGFVQSDPDEQALTMNGLFVMFVLNDGEVQVGDITKNATNSRTVPRLDFMRQTDSIPRKFASLDQNGILSVFDVNENLAPTGHDRMYLLGNPNCSIGLDGLLTAAGVAEISLLIPQTFVAANDGPYLVDQSSKMLTRYP